jgi:hypothetical protein
MEKAHNCDIRVHAYKNGKTMEQCREEARKNTELLSNKNTKVSWTRVLEVANHDELVYKLTLNIFVKIDTTLEIIKFQGLNANEHYSYIGFPSDLYFLTLLTF